MSRMILIAEPGKQETVISYIFDAPRDLVYKIFTDPTLIPQWWGPRYLTTEVEKMEVQPGGIWRYIQRDEAGNLFAFTGVYHEVLPPERLTYTFEYEGEPGHILLETVSFEAQDDKTKIIEKAIYQSVQDRDDMLIEGMEGGARESLERLSELLAVEFVR